MYGYIRYSRLLQILLVLLVINAIPAGAQKLNNPNKRGPLGTQVNTMSGNMFLARTDIFIPARGLDLDVSFYYNSFLYTENFGYGNGWSFYYNIKYRRDTAMQGSVLVMWGDGREDKYDSTTGGNFQAPRGFFNTFSAYQPGKYLLTEPDGMKYFFDDASHKKITRLEDANGNYIVFNYTNGALTNMSNAAGQAITFTYDSKNRLASAIDANGTPSRTYTYSYDAAGNLKEVKDPMNGSCQYTYLVNGPMKSLSDKNQNTVNIIYYPDLTTRELIGCNKRLSFSYDTISSTTMVTDHLETGNLVTKYTYQHLDNLSWITSVSGNCCGFNMSYEYDEQGNRIKSTDANGQVYTYTYDDFGNIRTATDPLGNVSAYTYTPDYKKIKTYTDPKGNVYTLNYDAKGNVTELITPGNRIYSATYNAAGDIISSKDPNGNTYTYNYDAWGNPVGVTGPNGYTATLSYDARGRLLSYADARGNNRTAEYDILDRLKKLTDPINNSIEFTYDAEGNITSYKNKNNETSIYHYDASNRLVKITGPTGNETGFAYDGMDNLLSVKNALGHELRLAYDKLNRLKTATDAEGKNIYYEHDGNGNLLSATFPNGRIVQYQYDQLNRLTSIGDTEGPILVYGYDKNGNIISITNGTGAVTTAAYDSMNRVIRVTDPLGNSTSCSYDKNGNMVSLTDREGHTTYFTYDGLDRVKTYTDNNGFVMTLEYDAAGNIVSLTDQKNNATTYTYDELNRRKRMTFPDGKYKEYSYDKKGNVTSVRLTDATMITYQYDTLNRVVNYTLPGGEVHSFTYDKLNRVLTATNSNGTVHLAYDNMDRVISETFEGRATQYEYNTSGRTQTIIYPDDTKVVKEYDTRNRLIRVTKDSVLVAAYVYNNANQPTQRTSGNGVSTLLQYDFANRLSNLGTTAPGGVVQNSQFSYDKQYNKTAVTRSNNPALSEEFTYDNGYRLTNYKRGPGLQNSYTYDAAGNRISANLNGVATTYGVNNLNQLTSVNATSFTFDDRGNLSYDGDFYKTYDGANRLIKDSSSPANVIVYHYDAFNRRIAKTINGNTLKYTYSGTTQIEERDGNDNLLNRTVFADYLAPLMNEKDGEPYYYHPNEMGSVEAITNSKGRLIETYHYDVYGKFSRFDSLNNPLAASAAGNRYAFTGQEYDEATGSYRFFYRNYSPTTGVFNQRDLIEYSDGMNMYRYVGNNPANGLDVWGLEVYQPEFNPPKPSNPGDCSTGSPMSFDDIWGKISDGKQLLEIFGAEKIKLPAKVKNPLDVMAPIVDGYNTTQNVMAAGRSKFGSTTQAMHVGDAVKNGTNAAIGAGGLGATAMEAYIGAEGMAFLELGGVGGNLGLAGVTLWGLDKEAQLIGQFGIQDPIEHEAFMNSLEVETYMWQQGRTDQEKVERIIKLSRLEQARRYRHHLLNNPCPEGGTRKRYKLVWDEEKQMWILVPFDPNLIVGPDGRDDKKWVSVKAKLPYTIMFENDSTATARARYIKITTPIEPKQDPATLELGSVGFNNQSFEVPQGRSSYYQRLDARDSTGVYVDLTAGYDVFNNEIFWELRAIDPVTLTPPDDPMAGFLMLKDTANPAYGNGFVNFTIKPRTDAQTLDTIGAKAFIVFDENEVIPTNTHTNTIDAVPPVSQLTSATRIDSLVTLQWTGADDPNGSGVDYYTVYVSTDMVNYSVLFPWVTGLDTTFRLAPDSSYCFFVLATDRVGQTEHFDVNKVKCAAPGNGTLPVNWLYFTGNNVGKDNILKWATASEQNAREFRLERSLAAGSFSEITVVPAAGNSSSTQEYTYTDRNIDQLNSEVMFYRVKQVDLDGRFTYSSVVRLHYRRASAPTIVYPNPTQSFVTVVLGDQSLVGTDAIVTDINGRVLQRIKLTASTQTINLQQYVNGIYLIRLVNKETLKVLKQ